MPTVTVIIPTYNRGRMVKEAIESVLGQDYEDFELIVVDDGSTDATLSILGSYLASYPHIRVLTQRNRGVSAARNAGILASRGQLIAFLDSDDLWLPGKLSAQVAFFKRHPHAMICQTEETWNKRNILVNPGKRHKKESGMIFERSVRLCLVSPSAVMLRKGLLDQVGLFDEQLPACEDYDMWLRVSCLFPIHLIDTSLVIKRGGHPDQLSKQPCLDRLRIAALVKILTFPPTRGLTPSQHSAAVHALREKCTIYATGCMKRNRTEEARQYLELRDRY